MIRTIPLLALLVIGCSTVTQGKRVDWQKASALAVGTPAKEVARALGRPTRREVQPDGTETWVYEFKIINAQIDPVSFIPFAPTKVNTQEQTETTIVRLKDGKLAEEIRRPEDIFPPDPPKSTKKLPRKT